MDGLEWKRQKWGVLARTMLKMSERLAVRYTDNLVADSMAIKDYFNNTYKKEATYIPYGAKSDVVDEDQSILSSLGVTALNYGLLIARIEPENRVEQAINSFVRLNRTLVVVGGLETRYAQKLMNLFAGNGNVIFVGSIYNPSTLNGLRKNSSVYFHGHSVGGTNPSLLDAMAAGCVIIANDNPFNKETLGNGGYYFASTDELIARIEMAWNIDVDERKMLNSMNINRIKEQYTWDIVVDKYIKMINCVAYE